MKNIFHKIISAKYLVIIFFLAVAFLTYLSSIESSFHFDDFANIVNNPDIKISNISFDSLARAASTKIAGFRPVAYVSFALNYYFSGDNTISYHVVNIIIHTVNAFLIFLITLSLFNARDLSEEKARLREITAFFTALIWLVHPLNSQSVIFIVQRMTLLMTFFFLLAFYFYILSRKTKNNIYLIFTLLFFVLSILAKQNGIMFPFAILTYEFIIGYKEYPRKIAKNEKLFLIAILFLLPIIVFFLFKSEIFYALQVGYDMRKFNLSQRLLTQLRMLVFYLSLLICPLPGRLSINHDIAISTSLLSPVTTLVSLLLLLSLAILSIVRAKRTPYFSFAILWFFVIISLESSIIPLELVYEHRVYLPGIFLIGVAVDYLVKTFYARRKITLILSLCSIVLFFSVMTGIRGKDWESELTLWSDVIDKYPDHARAIYNVGYQYFRAGDYDKALVWFHRSIEKDPEFTEALFGAGDIYEMKKNYLTAENYYKKTLDNVANGDDLHLQALNNLGSIYIKTNQLLMARKIFEELVILAPESGMVHYNLALTLKKLGDYKAAVPEYQAAITAGHTSRETYEGAVRTMVMVDDIDGLNSLYDNYNGQMKKTCLENFIKHVVAQKNNDNKNANQFFRAYMLCKNSR